MSWTIFMQFLGLTYYYNIYIIRIIIGVVCIYGKYRDMNKKEVRKDKHRIKSTNYTRSFDKESVHKLAHELYVRRQQMIQNDMKGDNR